MPHVLLANAHALISDAPPSRDNLQALFARLSLRLDAPAHLHYFATRVTGDADLVELLNSIKVGCRPRVQRFFSSYREQLERALLGDPPLTKPLNCEVVFSFAQSDEDGTAPCVRGGRKRPHPHWMKDLGLQSSDSECDAAAGAEFGRRYTLADQDIWQGVAPLFHLVKDIRRVSRSENLAISRSEYPEMLSRDLSERPGAASESFEPPFPGSDLTSGLLICAV
ncbi:hypothetical protein B484DRAFT_473705 [Ochromonadaceae sp. CCMP2298]|nr:hypothetical protein B484DRAFT_473705 [Ochromonadaceae sp. CCMP2298]